MAKINQTNLPDWSALIPVLPTAGTRARAVYAALRGLIEDGRLPPGAKLPPSRALAQQWGLARGAVVAGFEMLVADGFAVAQVGAGTFVAPQVPRAAVVAVSAPRAFVPMDLPGDLGLGFPDPLTLRQFRVILNRHLSRPIATLYHYADPQGDRALRAEVAQYLQVARGLRLHPDQVVLTSGTQGALDLVARAVLAPGDEVWMEDPGYPSGKAALVAQRLIPVPVDAEGLDVRAGIARAPGARAAYVTPSHQFPLGVAMTMPRRLELLAWADQIGGWIIEDDYDSEFRFTGAPLAALQGIDAAGRVIYVGTFSKALMPGLRVGYLVLPEALLGPVIDLRRRTDRAPPALGESALAELLAQGHFAAHLRRARRRVRAARDRLVADLRAAGLAVTPPDQGLHLLLDLAAGQDDLALAAAARATGFGARPLSPLYLERARQRPGLILGFSGHTAEGQSRAARLWLARQGEALRARAA
ncbi:GntR family transcriptional regulator [Gemmobacter lanyuensis]|uniref:GntR family transcriptional regulator n=1 Tax=Gemmobacter lanyuensis TaxID=1054497 RepID=A0A918MMJ6_9RHOB|nr:PLP-dependent aminotransferase family protein [Gemmobacter lanyuensis]GGW36662.1 GntR family transcriptional regulator [Gemmobacter lanyuensis]